MQAAVRQFEKPTFRPAATGQKRIDEPGKKGTKHNPRKRPQIMKSDKIKKQLNFMFWTISEMDKVLSLTRQTLLHTI